MKTWDKSLLLGLITETDRELLYITRITEPIVHLFRQEEAKCLLVTL